jgi:uroporphyrinogen-III synthase
MNAVIMGNGQNPAPLHVLVTRPAHQASNLGRMIAAAGAEAVCFPVIEITGPRDTTTLHALIEQLDRFDVIIFVSANAVDQAMPLINARHPQLPARLLVACVGRASAKRLKHFDIDAPLLPPTRFDSEGLLLLPELQQVAGKHILIFRGEGGRELLAQTLRARGAEVQYAECYRRVRPRTDITPLLRRWQDGLIDLVTITSVEALDNLVAMIGESGQRLLLNTPVVVVSNRIAEACRRYGFAHEPWIAKEASDEGLVEAVQAWRASQKPV